MNILGISAFYHDSAAALVQDGRIVAAASEERFTRVKQDSGLPRNAIKYCLEAGGVGRDGIDYVAFYDKPLTTFMRLIATYGEIAPRGFASFRLAIPQWLRRKLWIPREIERGLDQLGFRRPRKFSYLPHHLSHAASAYYPSPFERAAVLTMDGVGEWATSTIGLGEGGKLGLLQQLQFPHSLGFLYSAFTAFAGFKVNSGEYKLMGLAPYGEPRYVDRILDDLIDLRPDGSFRMNLEYFDFLGGLTMTSHRFADRFDGPARKPESRIERREMDLARSVQVVTEEIVLRMARHARQVTNAADLCLAGGVALNCVANGVLLRKQIFDRIWIQPAAGDSGGAIGAALHCWHGQLGSPRVPEANDSMQGGFLGPSFTSAEIEAFLTEGGYAFKRAASWEEWSTTVATHISQQKVVGMLQGRMEFGPRSLGSRSILGDPRSPKMQSVMNQKIKHRESFRPFAPAVLHERAADYFELSVDSPYMLLVAPVLESHRLVADGKTDLIERVNEVRSDIPAVTHVDYSARVQTVDAERNPRFHSVIKAFEAITGCGVVINTSFNVRGEPIVCTPADAYRCFMRTEMDVLVLEDLILEKASQPEFRETEDWRSTFALD